MAIQFIVGPSGTGKSEYIYEQMIAKSKDAKKEPVLFLLPEQSNMSAEKKMIAMHPQHGTMDISILSFTRLAFKVFDELNVHTKDILDDYGKSMLVMKIIKEHESELAYYNNMSKKPGFVDEIKSILSEFYQYQITQKVLSDVIANLNPEKSLYHKMSDLKIIMHAFEEEIAGKFMVAEQLLSLLKEYAKESKLLQNASIYFDAFSGFTPVQYSVIEAFMKMGCNLYFAVTMDADLIGKNDYSEQGLFALSKQTVDRLSNMAQACQMKVEPHVSFADNYRLKGKEGLLHLERNLFRFPVNAYQNNCEQVDFFTVKNATKEMHFVAKMIQKYVMEKGYHYNDFAIVCGDVEQRGVLFNQVMRAYEIPYFLDYSEKMLHNPIVELIDSLFEIFRMNFTYESVFALFKSGFFEMEAGKLYALENYCVQYGVRGYDWWNQPFIGSKKGLHEINETRRACMDILNSTVEVLGKKKAFASEYIRSIYDFMVQNEIAKKIYKISLMLEREERLREAKAYAQVYDKFIDVLEKTMDILGDEVLERDAFLQVLKSGVSDMHLGIIPSTLDQVIIGDMERSRLPEVKIIFVLGVNEGVLPKGAKKKGILVDRDRKQLKEMQVILAPDSTDEMFLQQFNWYLQLTKASEKIILSYREEDDDFGAMRPSYFFERMQRIFPNNPCHKWGQDGETIAVSKDVILMDFANKLMETSFNDASLLEVVRKHFPTEYDQMMQGYFYQNDESVLQQKIAKMLYGDSMVHSVSRLETYAGCAYQFFLQFGLGLQKREEYRVQTNNIGTILHAVMEKFFKWIKDEKKDLSVLSEQERNEQVVALTIAAAHEENETIFESSFRQQHQLDVLVRIAKRSVENLCRHLQMGSLKPAYFEEKFSPEMKLSYIDMALANGIQMGLRGIVDRVDIKETEQAVYVKVIDYKSGDKNMDYQKLYDGKQLQLTVYMNVMLEILQRQYPDKKIIPTGMYYFRLYDPIVEGMDEQEVADARTKASRLTGLVNTDDTCLEYMDGKTGSVVPLRFKKDGSIYAGSNAAVTQQELEAISVFVREKMIEIGNQITSGKIAMNPEKGTQNSPCNFCDYRAVCRFEAGLGGNAYKMATQLRKEEIKEKIFEPYKKGVQAAQEEMTNKKEGESE